MSYEYTGTIGVAEIQFGVEDGERYASFEVYITGEALADLTIMATNASSAGAPDHAAALAHLIGGSLGIANYGSGRSKIKLDDD